MPIFSIKFSQTFFCHSCFSLYNQKIGLDISNFYLIHKINKFKNVSLIFLEKKFQTSNSTSLISIFLKSKFTTFWYKFYYFSCFLIQKSIKQRLLIDTLLIFFCSFKFKILQQQNFQNFQIKKPSVVYSLSHLNVKMEPLDYFAVLSTFYKVSPFLSLKKPLFQKKVLNLPSSNSRQVFDETSQFSEFSLNKVDFFETEKTRTISLGLFAELEILPSPLSLLNHLKCLKKIITLEKVKAQKDLIQKLKNQIDLWCNNQRILSTRKNLFFCDFLLAKWVWKWACRRHSKKNHIWIRQKYYHSVTNNSFENSTHSLFSKRENEKICRFCIFDTFKKTFFCLPKHSDLILFKNKKRKTHYSIFSTKWKYWFNTYLFTKM